jgi:hypothetical protein
VITIPEQDAINHLIDEHNADATSVDAQQLLERLCSCGKRHPRFLRGRVRFERRY